MASVVSKSFRLMMLCSSALLPFQALAVESSRASLEDNASVTESKGEINAENLLDLSLEELSNITVTSVSKKAERASEAAAAVFVITQEDIRRSGATTIPDALRMAPGVNVAQSGAHDWAVSVRGFNSQFSNKLLVLIDGRTVYSPLFAGVLWELQDTLLEDIDRIEVIRGPGATQWGANAVNGVINIITKSSKDTQGGLAAVSAGNKIDAISSGRYGVKIADDSYIRMYAKYTDYDSQNRASGLSANDDWQKRQAGFRSDSKLTSQDTLTVQGDLYDTSEGADRVIPSLSSPYAFTTSDNIEASGGNVLARWTRNISPESSTTTQFYVDRAQYKTSFISYNTTTTDIDFQHTWTGWERNEFVWGVAYRLISDHAASTQQFSLSPAERNDSLYSAFVQDKITLLPDSVFLTLGSKFEHNAYTGIEIQPSARMSWLISDSQTVWGSVSRAVHTPSRYTFDGQLTLGVIPPSTPLNSFPIPVLVAGAGTNQVDSEELTAYELGYRIQPTKSSSIDVSAFYNDYANLFRDTLGTATPVGMSYIHQPVSAQNSNSARSVGVEVAGKWNASDKWHLAASYSYINLVFDNKDGGLTSSFVGNEPQNQFSIQSTYLFPYQLEMTNSLYYVDRLSGLGIPGYYRLDTKLSYPLADNMELSVVGQNLLDPQHKEFTPFVYQTPTEIGRSVYANLSIKF
jgi:iron complex outermembrane recepter protein